MNIDRRITNGLAWAGVVLVVGVPTADLLSAQFMGRGEAPSVAVIEPVSPTPAPASQRPAAPAVVPQTEVAAAPAGPIDTPEAAVVPAAQTADAVDRFLQSGKPLPSYITGGGDTAPAEVAATPPARPPVVTAPAPEPAAPDPVQVAAIPVKEAPVPMPLSMRPKPMPVVADTPLEPVVIPDSVVAPLPPANVTATDLEDWETGPLSEFLAARQQQQGSSATVTYDRDGFWLDEGPDGPRHPRDRYIGPAEDEVYFLPFGN
jgi:hypothetical protein